MTGTTTGLQRGPQGALMRIDAATRAPRDAIAALCDQDTTLGLIKEVQRHRAAERQRAPDALRDLVAPILAELRVDGTAAGEVARIMTLAARMQRGRLDAETRLRSAGPLSRTAAALERAAGAWAGIDQLGRLRVVRALPGEGRLLSPAVALELLPLIDAMLATLPGAVAASRQWVRSRAGVPPLADEVRFAVEALACVWERHGPWHLDSRGRRSGPIALNSRKRGSFGDLATRLLCGPPCLFRPAAIRTALRYLATDRRRAQASGAAAIRHK